MKLYHVSRDISLERKLFVPRVPKYRLRFEDDSTKRICTSPTIKDAFNGFSFKVEYVNREMKKKNNHYLSVYELEPTNYIGPEQLQSKVPDAKRTGEHWILEDIEASPRLIKVNEAKLNRYNEFINEYVGDVVALQYEEDVTDYDRTQDYIFISKDWLRKSMRAYRDTDVSFIVLEDRPFQYPRVNFPNADWMVTTRKYHFIKVRVTVPKGISAAKLWYYDNLQSEYAIRKRFKIGN